MNILNHMSESQNSLFKSSTTAHKSPLINYKPIYGGKKSKLFI